MHNHGSGFPVESLFFIPAVVALVVYWAGARSPRSGRWPWYRTVFFTLGVAAVLVTVLNPLAELAHRDFAVLSFSHLLAGMLSPLLLVLSRPFTLALRTLDVFPARRLSRVLRSRFARFLSFPVTAALLNTGGMILMFRTGLLQAMQESMPVHWLVTFHLLAAGYLFTASIVGRDPSPHRAGYRLRAIVLVLSIAAHNILAKGIYADPPPGIPATAAEHGALVMYYGGGILELVLIVLLCRQWYASARPRGKVASAVHPQ
ncbi:MULTISPECIES: cytochrome c oxidase assembly protein [unclassified Arthrobacter]|uniref:cytochrome c oxidase assembly protein n=1 Tax=unclassified Arthrobacter TaxID=235627 RepID=UPI0021024BA7|nr:MULTISPECIES: cytochrome c oxidase assembly protein [unclassified Arthrobacter]MCQ1947510.1 cytochrome c oxidase assembly protein [Arthrobacter sp. zg-Y1116]MCQ1987462.1 cytochrome c oxidase assembly protein [Arthrobacter sp. zg-Y844]MCQ1996806.1 cytochrome c oxidase assembly protein [Arthrobacter sp. zg-Y1171]UWX82399.1 cytochrome c oxidase assembly protein [Arthrobacter sp. zg-Y1171]